MAEAIYNNDKDDEEAGTQDEARKREPIADAQGPEAMPADQAWTTPTVQEVEQTPVAAQPAQADETAGPVQNAETPHTASPDATSRIDAGAAIDPTVQVAQAQPSKEKPGLFDGLSLAQIVAAAAAGATSMALSSTIGFGGSIINAAVSSVITVVCSQVYRHVLDATGEKVKEGIDSIGSNRSEDSTGAQTARPADEAGTAATVQTAMPNDETIQGTRVAPESLREEAEARETDKRSSTQKKVIIFSIVLAVIAVVVCAGAIILGTHGQGIGEKTEGIDLTEVVAATDENDDTADEEEMETEDDEESGSAEATDDSDEDAGSKDSSSSSHSSNSSSSQDSSSNSNEDSSSNSEDETPSDAEDDTAAGDPSGSAGDSNTGATEGTDANGSTDGNATAGAE